MEWKSPLGPALAGAVLSQGTAPAQPRKMSKGHLILGILADALAGAQGRAGAFAAQMGRDREQERERAEWGLQRQAKRDDYVWQKGVDQRFDKPDVPPMVRDAMAYMGMSPEQKAAWEALNKAKEGDPIVNVTLPNGQFYSGPRSGLATALTGGTAPIAAPPKPVGRLTPINGGLTPPASGTFRP